ncbi:MAG: PAS-domain containing protein [Ectothiorhodospiraceae bacterium]|nr:PAS-domain containing protein [Ectothiorhodospiraceae bacterium]
MARSTVALDPSGPGTADHQSTGTEADGEVPGRLAAVEALAGIGVWTRDLETGAVRWSQQCLRLLGLPIDSRLTVTTFAAMIDARDTRAREHWLAPPTAVGTCDPFEYRVRRADGALMRLRQAEAVERGSDGRALRILGTIQETGGPPPSNRFGGGFTATVTGELVALAPALADLLGYHPRVLVGRTLDTLHRRPEDWSHHLQSLLGGDSEVVEYEASLCGAKGAEVWAVISLRLRRGAKGDLIGIDGQAHDISDRKRAEAARRESEMLLREGLEAMPVGFAIFGPDERLELCNERYRAAFPLNRELVVPGVRFEDLVRPSAQTLAERLGFADGEAYLRWRMESFRSPSPRPWHYQQSTGRWIETWTCRASSGRFISIRADITERKTLEQQLMQAQKMEAIGQLTGGIAHDFNNLLAVILGNAELLALGRGKVEAKASTIMQAVARGSELTQRLLAFSRMQHLRPRPVDLGELVESMQALLGRTLGEGIVVSTEIDPDRWGTVADSGQVETALLNLANNARQAMPEGGTVLIRCRNQRLDVDHLGTDWDVEPGEYVVLSVSDTGVGMDPATRKRAFDPFFTTRPVGEGSGLGLSMVYGFARQSGGYAVIESALGAGTTVSIYLPRVEPSGDASEKPPAPAIADAEVSPDARRVLLVEDQVGLRGLVRDMLEIIGYVVSDVGDAAEARAVLAASAAFDLVLSDVVLPGEETGVDLARWLRAEHPELEVVLMSGYSEDHIYENERGPIEPVLLRKPFTIHELERELERVLRTRRG